MSVRTDFAVLHTPGKPDQFFEIVRKPVTDKGGYVEAISLTWFQERELKRAFPDGAYNHRTIKYCSLIYERSGAYREEFPEIPVVQVEGVFEFFKLIGYDYKAQRYITKE